MGSDVQIGLPTFPGVMVLNEVWMGSSNRKIYIKDMLAQMYFRTISRRAQTQIESE